MENVIKVDIKWNKRVLEGVSINLDESIASFKLKVSEMTNVPAEKQKLMYKGKVVKDDQVWAAYPAIKDGVTLMMMGTALGKELKKPEQEVKFQEDLEEEKKQQEQAQIMAMNNHARVPGQHPMQLPPMQQNDVEMQDEKDDDFEIPEIKTEMKKQISTFGYSVAPKEQQDDDQEAEQPEEELKKQPSLQSPDDPSKAEFWQDVIIDPFLENSEAVQEELIMELSLLETEKLSRKQSQILESGIKSMNITREKVHFRYETWIDKKDFQGEQTVFITGQFNNWAIEPMKLADETADRIQFVYECDVEGGQIYNYHLLIDGDRKIDPDQSITTNGKSNWIFVPLSSDNQQTVQRIFSKPLALRLFKLKKLAQALSEYSHLPQQEGEAGEILKNQKRIASTNYNRILVTVYQDLKSRLVCSKEHSWMPQAEREHHYMRIRDFSITADKQEIKIQRILDQNGIALNLKRFQNVQTINLSDFITNYDVIDRPQEIAFYRSLNYTRKHHFFIRYFADEGECFPLEVRPVEINMNDYNINFDANANVIRTISNKQLGTEILFADMSQETMQGYVNNSVVEIWTSLVPTDNAGETVNIMHIHVNDTSDEVTFDSAYMHEGETLADFQTFGTDMSGQKLRYKIVLAESKVHTVLYNLGEPGAMTESGLKEGIKALPFMEIRINPGQHVVTKVEGNAQKVLAVLDSFPTGMVASADMKKVQAHEPIPLKNQMISGCKDRGFEGLLGYVDIDVIAAWELGQLVVYDQPEKWAYPICQLEIAGKQDMQLYDVLVESKAQEIKDNFSSGLEALAKAIDEAKQVLAKIQQKTINKEAAQEFIKKYQAQLAEIEEAHDDIEEIGEDAEQLMDEAQ